MMFTHIAFVRASMGVASTHSTRRDQNCSPTKCDTYISNYRRQKKNIVNRQSLHGTVHTITKYLRKSRGK